MSDQQPTLIRTEKQGCWQLKTTVLGRYIAPTVDPLATVSELTPEQLKGFEINEDFPKIPADLWSRWLHLCFIMAERDLGELEVSCRLLRHEDDASRWRIIIPLQDVCGASVHADNFDHAIDIETGVDIGQYPPLGWVPMGSSHSHATMSLDRFSGVDDRSELGDPGVHILISHVRNAAKPNQPGQWTFRQTDSIVAGRRRFYLPAGSLTEAVSKLLPFHPDARAQVCNDRERVWAALSHPKAAASATRKINGSKRTKALPERQDPFFVQDDYSCQLRRPGTRPSVWHDFVDDDLPQDDTRVQDLLDAFIEQDDNAFEKIDVLFTEIIDTIQQLAVYGNEQEALRVITVLLAIHDGDTHVILSKPDVTVATEEPAYWSA